MAYCRVTNKKLWDMLREDYPDEMGEYVDSIHGSDLYVIGSHPDEDGCLYECMGCSLMEHKNYDYLAEFDGKIHTFRTSLSSYMRTPEEMIAHFKKHISVGDRVPREALDRVMKEIGDEVER